LAHRLAVSELYVRLRGTAEKGQLALLEFAAEPACWRAFIAPLRGATTLKPDAFLRIAVDVGEELELWWFVEIDRGTVSQATRARQAAAYRAYWRSGAAEVMPRVLWVATDAVTAEQATAAAQPDLEPKGLFVVTTEEQALDALVTAKVRS
jgi:Replication-relaxation